MTTTAIPDRAAADEITGDSAAFEPSILRTLHEHEVKTHVWRSAEDHDLSAARRAMHKWRLQVVVGPVTVEQSYRTRDDARQSADMWNRLHTVANSRRLPSAVQLAEMARYADSVSAPRELHELVVAYRDLR